MSQMIFTHDLRCELRPEADKIDLQIDFTIEGTIVEIRAWSYEFQHWIPVQILWLKAILPSKFDDIQETINAIKDSPGFFPRGA